MKLIDRMRQVFLENLNLDCFVYLTLTFNKTRMLEENINIQSRQHNKVIFERSVMNAFNEHYFRLSFKSDSAICFKFRIESIHL